uniref:Lysozyme g n=1 Tax=Dicentrarchus labrax TaxID=13489 RepID=A0A8P4KU00_DICLA
MQRCLPRPEEPRVRRRALQGKNDIEISDVLVTTFTESGVVEVVLDALKEIGCNEQRENFGYGNIMKVETTGASEQTAQQDNLNYSGVRASSAMAETDLEKMKDYKSIIKNVARQKGIDPALIAAIISRSCRAGKTLKPGGRGRYDENSYGLMQIYVNPNGDGNTTKVPFDSEDHLLEGTNILIYFILRIKNAFPDWSKEQQLKGGIAAYNAGDGNIHSYEEVDAKTTCGDYSNDVIARAQWYKRNGGF